MKIQQLKITYWVNVICKKSSIGRGKLDTYPHAKKSHHSISQRMEHQHMTASDPNHNPIGAPIIISGSTSIGFGYLTGYPFESPRNNPTLFCANNQSTQCTKWNSNQRSFPCAKLIENFQAKKYSGWFSNSVSSVFSQHHTNFQAKLRSILFKLFLFFIEYHLHPQEKETHISSRKKVL